MDRVGGFYVCSENLTTDCVRKETSVDGCMRAAASQTASPRFHAMSVNDVFSAYIFVLFVQKYLSVHLFLS